LVSLIMGWLPLGLLSTGLHAVIAVTDKVILEKYLKNGWAYPSLPPCSWACNAWPFSPCGWRLAWGKPPAPPEGQHTPTRRLRLNLTLWLVLLAALLRSLSQPRSPWRPCSS
jgi:hypothetical protein